MTLPTLFLAVGQCKSQTGLKLRLKRFAFFALDPTGYLHPLAMILQQMMLTLQNIQNTWVRLSRNKISNESPFGIFLLLLWVFFFWLAFGLVYFGLVFFFLFVCWFICAFWFVLFLKATCFVAFAQIFPLPWFWDFFLFLKMKFIMYFIRSWSMDEWMETES